MDYHELKELISNPEKMQMRHICQPVMMRTLLKSEGRMATTEEMARQFAANNPGLISYYKKRARIRPHNTLKKHSVVGYEKDRYTLLLDGQISGDQRDELIGLCTRRIEDRARSSKSEITYRELDKRAKSGSVRSDVLAMPKGVCVSCGVAAR